MVALVLHVAIGHPFVLVVILMAVRPATMVIAVLVVKLVVVT